MSVPRPTSGHTKTFSFSEEDQKTSSGDISPKESSKKNLPSLFSSVLTTARHSYAPPSCRSKDIIVDLEQRVMFCQNGKSVSILSTMPTVYLTNFKVKEAVRFMNSRNGSLCRGNILMCKNSKIGNLEETRKYATISILPDSPASSLPDSPASTPPDSPASTLPNSPAARSSNTTISVLPDTPMAESSQSTI